MNTEVNSDIPNGNFEESLCAHRRQIGKPGETERLFSEAGMLTGEHVAPTRWLTDGAELGKVS
ncbi:hypothetical protein [Zoogloea sp.]|uniref:hypothetical protein n=1 Tax=Zoogloea sp. TaxID=49181 RepID=UPI0025E5F218|nr:hypothetical protein [Zoogloea sp.]MCK6395916.1 hypothetical protein [Zoogloea sp.]